MVDELKEILKLTSGIGPKVTDEEVNVARRFIVQCYRIGRGNQEEVIKIIQEQIYKHRRKKTLSGMETMQAKLGEKVIIESLKKRGLIV